MTNENESDVFLYCDGRKYRLVDPQLASYPQYARKKVDGIMRTVQVGAIEYTHVKAVLIGNDEIGTGN